MFDTGSELEAPADAAPSEASPDTLTEATADASEKHLDSLFVAIPAVLLFGLGFVWIWAHFAALLYAYTGYLFVHVITRPAYSVRLAAVRAALFEFLPVHLCFLLFVGWGEYEWVMWKSFMPELLTHSGRKGSLYLWLGLLIALAVGYCEYQIVSRRLDRVLAAKRPR